MSEQAGHKCAAWSFTALALYVFVCLVLALAYVGWPIRVGLFLAIVLVGYFIVFGHTEITNPPAGETDEAQAEPERSGAEPDA